MHYSIQEELARARHADLLREAEAYGLARSVRGQLTWRERLVSFVLVARRRRVDRRPAPAF